MEQKNSLQKSKTTQSLSLYNKWALLTVVLMISIVIVQAAKIESDHVITSLPYLDQKTYTINGVANTTVNIVCSRALGVTADSCPFTNPSQSNISFSNSTSKNITFDIVVPNGTPNQNVTETYELMFNGSKIANFSIEFNIFINVPVPDPEPNFQIISFTPANNSYFGQFDSLPTFIVVTYTGDIDFSQSTINLFHNGLPVTWYDVDTTSNTSFRLELQQIPDGSYSGNWVLKDSNGTARNIQYSFHINQDDPPAPVAVSPEKGRYTNEIRDIIVTMDTGNYTLFYLVNDGYPPIGSTRWASMSYIDGQYILGNFDFSKAGLGQIYLKVVDKFGNIAIFPTALISAPSIDFDIEERTKTVGPGDEVALEVDLRLKKDSGTKLRCKMEDFIANEDDDDEVSWPVKAHASLRFEDDEDVFMDLYNDFEETLVLPTGITSKLLELVINIPLSAKVNEDYESNVECIIIK